MEKIRKHLIAFLGYVILTLIFNFELLGKIKTHVLGCFDVWSMLWMVWWWKTSIIDYHRLPYFVDVLAYPHGIDYRGALGNHLTNLASTPIYSLTGNLALTYNIFVLASIVLSGFTAYLLVFYLTKNGRASFIAGMVYTFSPYHMGQVVNGISGLVHIEWIPLCLLFLLKTLREKGLKNPVYAAIFFSLTSLSDFNYMFYTGLVVLLFVYYHRIEGRITLIEYKKFGVFAVASLILLSPALIQPVLWFFTEKTVVPLQFHNHFAANAISLFVPSMYHKVFGPHFESVYGGIDKRYNRTIVYLGWSVIIFILYSFSRINFKKTGFWIVLLLTSVVFALGPTLEIGGFETRIGLPELFLNFSPILSTLHAPARIIVYSTLALSVLVGLGLDAIQNFGGRKIFLLLFSLLILFDFLPVPYYLSDTRVSPFFDVLESDDDAIAILNLPRKDTGFVQKHQYYQTFHKKKNVWGYLQWNVLNPRIFQFYGESPIMSVFDLESKTKPGQEPRPEIIRCFFSYYGINRIIIFKDYFRDYFETFLNDGRYPTIFNKSILFEADLMYFNKSRILVEEIFNVTPYYEDRILAAYRLPYEPLGELITFRDDGWNPSFFTIEDEFGLTNIYGKATLKALSPKNVNATLNFTIKSPCDLQVLEISVNNISFDSIRINSKDKLESLQLTNLPLSEGENLIEFEVQNKCEKYGEKISIGEISIT